MMKFYVYVLYDGDLPFYVGKGTKNRMYIHYNLAVKSKTSSPVLNKIRSMISKNKEITYLKTFETDDETLAFIEEINLILKYGRVNLKTGPLLNLTSGGEGVTNYIYTDEHRKNLSNAIKKAIKENRHIPPGYKFVRDDNYKKKQQANSIEFWESPKGVEQKHKTSLKGKSLLVNGKRVLSDAARQKMRESALRTNELKKRKT